MEEIEEIDPELLGTPLDLSRPELRPILDRYFPRTALIVGRGDESSGSLNDALIEAGWQVRSCGGPGRLGCPLPQGKPACYLRETADVAIVYVDVKSTSRSSGLLLPLLCAADAASPAVLALEGRMCPPETTSRFGVVGALRSGATIMKTVSAIVEPNHRGSRETPSE